MCNASATRCKPGQYDLTCAITSTYERRRRGVWALSGPGCTKSVRPPAPRWCGRARFGIENRSGAQEARVRSGTVSRRRVSLIPVHHLAPVFAGAPIDAHTPRGVLAALRVDLELVAAAIEDQTSPSGTSAVATAVGLGHKPDSIATLACWLAPALQRTRFCLG